MRVSEIYPSIQGEGPHVGLPTTFVRFAGCNMRCPGWPCDTPYSIYPEIWRKEATDRTPVDILDSVSRLAPRHVCITGGEPLLQPREDMKELVDLLLKKFTIDVFTNGTRPLDPLTFNTYDSYTRIHSDVTIILDWKLKGSGEADTLRQVRGFNRKRLRRQDYVKFVCASDDDFEEAVAHLDRWRQDGGIVHQVSFGVAWGGHLRIDRLAERLAYYGHLSWVHLNVQVHKYVFGDRRAI